MEDDKILSNKYLLFSRILESGRPSYWLETPQSVVSFEPKWKYSDEFLTNLLKQYNNTSNQKTTSKPEPEKKPKRVDNIGGFTNFTTGKHIERIKNGKCLSILT